MVDWRLRFRAVLSKRFQVVLGVLVVLALAGGWMTYTAYAAPDTQTDQQEAASWETTSAFDHSATVVRDSSVFSQGTTLTDRPVYFSRLSPELDGTFQTAYDASGGSRLDQTVSLSLVMREVDDRDQGDEAAVHWETSEELNSTTVDAVEPGEPVSVSFSRNMSAVDAETSRIQDELGGTVGETEVFVRATVRSTGTVDGAAVNETSQYTLPVTVDENTYRIADDGPIVDQHGPAQPATVDETAGSIGTVSGPLLLVVSIGLLIGLVTVGKPDTLSKRERAALAYERDRESFDEWISTIKLPSDAFELPRAEAASLGELVDLAIDTDNRVIEDPDSDVYYVRHDGYLYSYRPTVDEFSSADIAEATTESPETDGPGPEGSRKTEAEDGSSSETTTDQ